MNPNMNFSYKSSEDIQRELNDGQKSKKSKKNNIDFVNDGLSTQDIRKTIDNIKKYIENNKNNQTYDDIISKLRKDYSFFAKRYPMLFDMATRNDNKDEFSANLQYFLNMRDRIVNNELTTDEASKQVGQDWFDKFVDISKMKNNTTNEKK
jgi:uncharacterized protein YeeX (DUF496 family)